MPTLVLPGLRLPVQAGFRPAEGLALPALSYLLGRASGAESNVSGPGGYDWLASQLQTTLGGMAAMTRAVDLPLAEPGHWLRADPVHLRIDRDRALLFDAALLDIGMDEAQQLIDALNKQFAEDGLHFIAAAPDRWYVRLPDVPRFATSPLHAALGQDVREHMPQGEGALRWHGMLNEIQMLMYTQPVNDERERTRRLPINSIWLWGEGEPSRAQAKPWHTVYAGDIAVRAMAHAAGSPQAPLPERYSDQLADSLVWLDTLLTPARYGDLDAWRRGLETLERDWFAPVLAAGKQGAAIDLVLPGDSDTLVLHFGATERWKFWRRPQTVDTLLQRKA